jgi:hypothetical protein
MAYGRQPQDRPGITTAPRRISLVAQWPARSFGSLLSIAIQTLVKLKTNKQKR